ncbi:MAG: transcriptional regulator, partial [Gammaproteobacteria bacterium]|nr:transcriptional regulator [Gammaproteobacteria bacterium]
SRLAVLNAEKGNVRLKVLVAILSALDLAGQLDLFLPSQDVSPIQLARLKGKARQRASGQRKTRTGEPPEW